MGDQFKKLKNNVPGNWYVDSNCMECGLCSDYAPEIFEISDSGLARVIKQPITKEELDNSALAMEDCPAGSIGDDG